MKFARSAKMEAKVHGIFCLWGWVFLYLVCFVFTLACTHMNPQFSFMCWLFLLLLLVWSG